MATTPRKPIVKPELDVVRIDIPPIILKQFQETPRIVIRYRPDGIWPIPPEWFQRIEFWRELAANKEFNEKYEVVIMMR